MRWLIIIICGALSLDLAFVNSSLSQLFNSIVNSLLFRQYLITIGKCILWQFIVTIRQLHPHYIHSLVKFKILQLQYNYN